MRFDTLEDFESFLIIHSKSDSDWIYLRSEGQSRLKKDLNITIICPTDLEIITEDLFPEHPFAEKMTDLIENESDKIVYEITECNIQIRQNGNLMIEFEGYYFYIATDSEEDLGFTITFPKAEDIATMTFSPIQKSIIRALNQHTDYIRSILTLD